MQNFPRAEMMLQSVQGFHISFLPIFYNFDEFLTMFVCLSWGVIYFRIGAGESSSILFYSLPWRSWLRESLGSETLLCAVGVVSKIGWMVAWHLRSSFAWFRNMSEHIRIRHSYANVQLQYILSQGKLHGHMASLSITTRLKVVCCGCQIFES